MLDGKVIIVTGASSGIGKAAASQFANDGAKVVLGARRAESLEELTNRINADGGEATYLPGNVENGRYAADLVSLALDRFGRLDAAFNNAGITGDMAPVTDMSEENWRKVISVNLDSAFHAAKSQIPALRRTGGGAVVFTSSFVGHTIGLPGMTAYAASKAGLIGMTQVLAAEHGPENIRVNALLPGGTKTDMAGDDPKVHEWIRGLHALKRMADPDEVARVAMFLLSDHASFVTGSALVADGGNSINKT